MVSKERSGSPIPNDSVRSDVRMENFFRCCSWQCSVWGRTSRGLEVCISIEDRAEAMVGVKCLVHLFSPCLRLLAGYLGSSIWNQLSMAESQSGPVFSVVWIVYILKGVSDGGDILHSSLSSTRYLCRNLGLKRSSCCMNATTILILVSGYLTSPPDGVIVNMD